MDPLVDEVQQPQMVPEERVARIDALISSGDDERPLVAMKRPAAKPTKARGTTASKKRARKQDDAKEKKKAMSTKHDEDGGRRWRHHRKRLPRRLSNFRRATRLSDGQPGHHRVHMGEMCIAWWAHLV